MRRLTKREFEKLNKDVSYDSVEMGDVVSLSDEAFLHRVTSIHPNFIDLEEVDEDEVDVELATEREIPEETLEYTVYGFELKEAGWIQKHILTTRDADEAYKIVDSNETPVIVYEDLLYTEHGEEHVRYHKIHTFNDAYRLMIRNTKQAVADKKAFLKEYAQNNNMPIASAVIKLNRTLKNMTGEELAQKMGINNQAIYRWESGVVPSAKNKKKLAEALDISIDEFKIE